MAGNHSNGRPSANLFFERPILNNPYRYPQRHWELNDDGQPTHQIVEGRRPAEFISPFPLARGQEATGQESLGIGEAVELGTDSEQYLTAQINAVRGHVDRWRKSNTPGVTPTTQKLLQHWRNLDPRYGFCPFFCQIEAVETAIWMTEVAPVTRRRDIVHLLSTLQKVSHAANPGLNRLALKMATGAGKTTVMAMLIAWQTLNAVQHPNSPRFTRGFLVVTPGITIRDRLRVLQPNDPDAYYKKHALIPNDMLGALNQARIVIANYHAFKLRERASLPKGSRSLLAGPTGRLPDTTETEGQMLQRVCPQLLQLRRVIVFNDEAHHCYREKPDELSDLPGEDPLKADEREEARGNSEAARLWISGLEMLARRVDVPRVFDLSATPFFLSGSGYAEGTLFPWTMSDFSLMDAIECGIVKLPRIPVSDNIPGDEVPIFRKLWDNIRDNMPKKARGSSAPPDPRKLPMPLQTALEALYSHYKRVFREWRKVERPVDPCLIIVCNNTASSKLVYDFVSGFEVPDANGNPAHVHRGSFDLFSNFDENGRRLARPRTLLIDSLQLESGDALPPNFKKIAAAQIERFRRERVERTGNRSDGADIPDQDLLREVMNTVGKPGTLGDSIRCVVSVSMLTEGWDASTVTHVLGVRAFGTQLLCEQAVGRALRRQSYELNEEGLFDVEYADVLGIPFDFTAEPVVVKPVPPKPTIHVQALRPDRDALEIRFPRVAGYRVVLPDQRLSADFNEDHVLTLTPDMVGAARVENRGIIGKTEILTPERLPETRTNTIVYHLARHLVHEWRESDHALKPHLFGDLKRIARDWLKDCLVCESGTFPAQILYLQLAEWACERITSAIVGTHAGRETVKAMLHPYEPLGTTADVNFHSSRPLRHRTERSHVNWAICDSTWEKVFCHLLEGHPQVRAYVKNDGLGFTVPWHRGTSLRTYIPDFIVQVDDGHGPEDLLNLVVEIKGYRGEDAKDKKRTMDSYWIPGVNNHGVFGRWKFTELRDIFAMEADFEEALDDEVDRMIERALRDPDPVTNDEASPTEGDYPDSHPPSHHEPQTPYRS